MGRHGLETTVADAGPWKRFLALLPQGGTLPAESWARRHRGIVLLLWAHAAFIPAYALVMGYSAGHTLAEALVVPTAAAIATSGGLSRRVRTTAASLGLLSSSAVLVHLSGGLIEMHFHFFVMVAVVSLYQDWVPFLAAIGYVFVHHGLIGALDPGSVFNHPAAIRHPWKWAAVHALFITGISVASLVNWRLNEAILAQRRQAEARLREESRVVERLDEVGRMLAADLDLDHVVQRVTDVATELTSAQFGAFFYNVSDDAGDSYLLYSLSGVAPEAFAGFPMPRATSVFGATFSGEAVVRLDDVTADSRYGQNPPYRGMPAGHLPVRSYLAVPVVSRGTVIGGLFFGHGEVGRFTEGDERVVLGIAAHAAVAVSNARLYEAERQARELEEAARERLSIVADAGRRLLSSSLDVDAAMTDLAQVVVPRVADGCRIDLVEDGGRLRRAAAVTQDRGIRTLDPSRVPIFDPGDRNHPATRALRDGQAELLADGVAGLDRLAGVLGRNESGTAEVPPASALVVPLPGRDGVLGVMTLVTHRSSGRHLGTEDVELADMLARRAATAADQAALFAAQQAAAQTLQHSLLPETLPSVPGMELAARYLPGGAGVEVGGDWYDVIALPDGTVGLAMGDVVGKGVLAASLMSQLRNGLRACARDGRPPAEIIELLNDLLAESDSPGQMATLVYGVFDPAAGQLTVVNAGHPPPVLRRPDGEVTFVETASGLPLGALPDSRYTATSVTLDPGSTLLFYTDGLVETRDIPLDEGMERLRSCAFEELGCDQLCDAVVARCSAGPSSRDDMAVLAVRYLALGDELHLSLPARPGTLQPLRSVMRRWLREGGASEEEVFDVVMATGEACANAIRHAPATGEAFEVDGHRDGDVYITIRNPGGWREPFGSGDGGRGLSIMKEFMDDVTIAKGPPETVVTIRHTMAHQRTAAPA